jgi:hypothetical protein
MTIELSADDIEVLRESLEMYLADFRREVAGTENPEMRHRLQRKQNALGGHPDAPRSQGRSVSALARGRYSHKLPGCAKHVIEKP